VRFGQPEVQDVSGRGGPNTTNARSPLFKETDLHDNLRVMNDASSNQKPFGQNPFANLSGGSPPGQPLAAGEEPSKKNRGRVDIIRNTAGRGGKTVTVVANFIGIGLPEKEKLAKEMQKTCGTGGTVKDGRIEIQGDKREEVARILAKAGFRPVFAGG
jgi:translation initiation factor 1